MKSLLLGALMLVSFNTFAVSGGAVISEIMDIVKTAKGEAHSTRPNGAKATLQKNNYNTSDVFLDSEDIRRMWNNDVVEIASTRSGLLRARINLAKGSESMSVQVIPSTGAQQRNFHDMSDAMEREVNELGLTNSMQIYGSSKSGKPWGQLYFDLEKDSSAKIEKALRIISERMSKKEVVGDSF